MVRHSVHTQAPGRSLPQPRPQDSPLLFRAVAPPAAHGAGTAPPPDHLLDDARRGGLGPGLPRAGTGASEPV